MKKAVLILLIIILLSSLLFNMIVEDVIAEVAQKEPCVVDSSGKTTFHGVFVGMTEAGENDAKRVKAKLEKTPGWADKKLLLGSETGDNQATKNNIKNAIDACKDACKKEPEKTHEFVFYFGGHGGGTEDTDGDEPAKKQGLGAERNGDDDHIRVADGAITDDDLTQWLSGFPEKVSIVIILDCCWAGHFVGGSADLQTIKDANGNPVCKFGILMSAKNMEAMFWGRGARAYGMYTNRLLRGLEECDGDGIITADELSDYAGPRTVSDDDNDGKVDEDPPNGKDDDGDDRVDEDFKNKPNNNDDGDSKVDEDPRDGKDNDGDSKVDEDPPNKPPKQDPKKYVKAQDEPPHEEEYVYVIPSCCPYRFVGYTVRNEVDVGQTFNAMLSIDITNDTSPATPPTSVIAFEIIPESFTWATWDLPPEYHNSTTAIWAFFGEDIRDINITYTVNAADIPGTYYFMGFVKVDGLKIAYLGDDEIVARARPPPPPPFGGIVVPVDKFGLLVPYIALASTILVATAATAIYVKRVKRRKEKQ